MQLTETERAQAEKLWPRQGDTPWSKMTDEEYAAYIWKWRALLPKEGVLPCSR